MSYEEWIGKIIRLDLKIYVLSQKQIDIKAEQSRENWFRGK